MTTDLAEQEIPNRFDYAEAQTRIYQMWEDDGSFRAEPNPDREPYAIVIPPPNVTGALHLGHALNNTLQDIVIRMKRMQGFNTLWMPGTDHAGIATQAVVERRLKEEENLTRHELGRAELVARIWQWKEQYEARILSQLKQMGCSCDWQRTRFTLDETCARAVRTTFFDLFRKGLIYRGKRLVNWDTYLQTAVSDDEVFHEEIAGHFWHYQYPVIDPQPGEPDHVTIATTRPETMLGDAAVATHPDPASALDKVETELTERLAKAAAKEQEAIQAQIDQVRARRAEMLGVLEQLRDMARDGRMLELPLTGRQVPLICDPWAKPELGSGCVKVTPAHDPNDYEVGLRCELEMINIMHRDGTLNDNVPEKYRGMSMQQARSAVVADLEQAGLLLEVEDRLIDLGHSDRSKTPIEPFLADQWFVRMDRLAQSAMDAVTSQRVSIFPQRYTKTYLDWLGEKRDWPIGRQLWWGHRIPIWTKTWSAVDERWARDQYVDDGESVSIEKLDATKDHQALLMICVNDGCAEIEAQLVGQGFAQEDEVLDTWFSSGLWPHSTLGWPDDNPALEHFYPTSTLITSRDIITLWVARMVLMGLNNMDDVPFREVFIHPKILDGYGETMSKSKGNGVDPLDVIDKFGADALRFGLAYLTTETQDVRMPVQFECPACETLLDQTKKNRQLGRIECPKCNKPFSTQWAESEQDRALPRGPVVSERFEQARNFCNKLWNASRFVLMNLDGYSSAEVSDQLLKVEDRWLLSRLSTVTENVTKSLDTYHYADAARELYEFAWDEFCSFYVEMAKSRLQEPASREVAQRVIAYALDILLRLLHPMIPFITEEVWQLLGKIAPVRGLSDPQPSIDSIIIAPWPVPDEDRQDQAIEDRFALFQTALGAIREIRSRQNIAPKDHVQFCIRCDSQSAEKLKPMQNYFVSMANAESTGIGAEITEPETHALIRESGLEVFVDLKDHIDIAAEIARNEKEADRIKKQISSKEAKLQNASFVDRAPAAIVQRERDSLAQLQDQLQVVEASLTRLRNM